MSFVKDHGFVSATIRFDQRRVALFGYSTLASQSTVGHLYYTYDEILTWLATVLAAFPDDCHGRVRLQWELKHCPLHGTETSACVSMDDLSAAGARKIVEHCVDEIKTYTFHNHNPLECFQTLVDVLTHSRELYFSKEPHRVSRRRCVIQ